MRAMTVSEQKAHAAYVSQVETALRLIYATKGKLDEDLRVTAARLENWLSENRSRWVA